MKAAERLKLPDAQQRGVHLSMHPLYDPPLERWINGFLDRWLAADTRVASVPVKSSGPRPSEFAAAAG
jgi:GMP synthase (glutamine-hydrolysing)